MSKKERSDLNLHIALVGISISILTLVAGISVYIARLDSSVASNTKNIKEMRTVMQSTHDDVLIIKNSLPKKEPEPKMLLPLRVAGGAKR